MRIEKRTFYPPVNANYPIFWRYYLEPYNCDDHRLFYYPYQQGIQYKRKFYPSEMLMRNIYNVPAPLPRIRRFKRRPINSAMYQQASISKRVYSNPQLSSIHHDPFVNQSRRPARPNDIQSGYNQPTVRFRRTRSRRSSVHQPSQYKTMQTRSTRPKKINKSQKYSKRKGRPQKSRRSRKRHPMIQPHLNVTWEEPIGPIKNVQQDQPIQVTYQQGPSGKGRRKQSQKRIARTGKQSSTKLTRQRSRKRRGRKSRKGATGKKSVRSRKVKSINSAQSSESTEPSTLSFDEESLSFDSKSRSTASRIASLALGPKSQRKSRLIRSKRRKQYGKRKINNSYQRKQRQYFGREKQLSQPDALVPDPSYVPDPDTMTSEGSIDLSNRRITRSMSRAMRQQSLRKQSSI